MCVGVTIPLLFDKGIFKDLFYCFFMRCVQWLNLHWKWITWQLHLRIYTLFPILHEMKSDCLYLNVTLYVCRKAIPIAFKEWYLHNLFATRFIICINRKIIKVINPSKDNNISCLAQNIYFPLYDKKLKCLRYNVCFVI